MTNVIVTFTDVEAARWAHSLKREELIRQCHYMGTCGDYAGKSVKMRALFLELNRRGVRI